MTKHRKPNYARGLFKLTLVVSAICLTALYYI